MPDSGLPEGWRRLPVRALLSVSQSGTWGEEARDGGGVRVLRSTNLTRDGRLTLEDVALRDIPTRDRDRKAFKDGDVMLERSGGGPGQPVGRVARIRGLGEVYCGNFCQQLRADPSVCTPDFLFRALSQLYERGVTSRLEHRTTGIRNLDFDGYLIQHVPVPPPEEQVRIAEVLDSIDAAIEKTEAVIAATEQLRSALLGELLTRGVPGWHTEWKDVPGIGTIPACWDVVRLGDVIREPIRNGYSAHAAREETGWWILTLSAVSPSGFDPRPLKPVKADPLVLGSALVPGDLLVSRSNTRERVGLAGTYRGQPANCSYPDLLMRVRPDTGRTTVDYLETVLLSAPGRAYFEREARGTSGSMVKIDREILMRFPIPLPPVREQSAIQQALESIAARSKSERAQWEALRATKDVTAGCLLSGRIRVPGERNE